MPNAGFASLQIIPSLSGVQAALTSQITGPAADAGNAAGKSLSDGLLGQTKDTGKKLVAALGIAAVGVIAVKSAEDVEGAQNTIIRTTGATGKAAEGLEQSFRNVASGTAASFDTVSTTLSQLYQRTGLQGKALEGLTSQVVSFNRQFKDSPITVDALTKSLAGFNVPGDQMGKVLDHLFIISQKTGEPLTQLLGDVQSGGPILRQFGFSAEDSASFLGKLNKAGLDANQIIPGLKKVFKEAADAGKDPRDALEQIITNLDGLVKAGDIAGARNLAVQVFGAKGVGLVDAALAGKLSIDDFNTSISTTGDGILETGKKTGTLAGAMGILKNNAQLALASFATPGLEAANDLLRSILPTVQSLSEKFTQLPDGLQLGVVAVVGLGIGLGKLGEFVTNVGPGLLSMGGSIATGFQLAAVKGLELVESIAAMTAAEIALNSIALVGIAAAGAGAFVITTKLLNAVFDRGGGQFEHLAEGLQHVKEAARDVTGPTETLVPKFKALVTAVSGAEGSVHGNALVKTLRAFHEVANLDIDTAARLALQFPKTSDKFKAMAGVLFDLASQHNAAAAAEENQGLALAQVTGQVDITTDAYKNSVAQFGAFVTTIAATAGVTSDTLDALAQESSQFATSLEGSIASFTDPFSHFSSQLDVGQEDFEKFFVGSQLQAADWANEITDLVNRGVDEGMLQKIAQAGPSSKPLLDDFVREVDIHGKDWVNSVNRAGEDAAKITEKTFQQMVVSAAVHTSEESLLVQANTADMASGGTANLEALLHNSDTNLAKMAYGALLKLGEIRGGIDSLPTDHPFTFSVGVTGLDELQAFFRLIGDNANAEAAGYIAGVYGVPKAATGGIFSMPMSGGPAILHGDEAVLPLSDPRRSWELIQQSGLVATMPSAARAGGDGFSVEKLEQNFYGELPSPAKQATETSRMLRNAAHLVQ